MRSILVAIGVIAASAVPAMPVSAQGGPALTIEDTVVFENGAPESGFTSDSCCAFVAVRLSTTATVDVTFDFATFSGTAATPNDYQDVTGSGVIPAGQTATSVRVPLVNDNVEEPDETFGVDLSNVDGATVADATAIVTIRNEDDPGLTLSGVSVRESGGFADFEVVLARPADADVTFDFTTFSSSALAGRDFTHVSGTDRILAGNTRAIVGVPVLDDAVEESLEDFRLRISNASAAEILVAEAAAVISDDDAPADVRVSIGATPDAVRRGDQVTYAITVANEGPQRAEGVVLRDGLPSTLRSVAFSSSHGSCTGPGLGQTGTVACAVGALDAGAAATVHITVTVHAPKKTVVANTVSVASRTRDPEAANDSATALTEVR